MVLFAAACRLAGQGASADQIRAMFPVAAELLRDADAWLAEEVVLRKFHAENEEADLPRAWHDSKILKAAGENYIPNEKRTAEECAGRLRDTVRQGLNRKYGARGKEHFEKVRDQISIYQIEWLWARLSVHRMESREDYLKSWWDSSP